MIHEEKSHKGEIIAGNSTHLWNCTWPTCLYFLVGDPRLPHFGELWEDRYCLPYALARGSDWKSHTCLWTTVTWQAASPQEGMNCEDGCRDTVTKGNFKWFVKWRGSRLGAAIPSTVPRHSEKTLVRRQIWQRPLVFLTVQFIVLPVFRCARAFTRTSQQALHKPMGSWSHRETKAWE